MLTGQATRNRVLVGDPERHGRADCARQACHVRATTPSSTTSPTSPGVSIVYAYKLQGGTLTLIAQRDLHGPVTSTLIVQLVRVK